MKTIEQSIEIDAPTHSVYNQWTQFEEFPTFMEGIEEVRQLDDTHLHWVAKVGGRRQEWDAEIHEQVPDQRIAWRAVSGKQNEGLVTFEKTSNNKTLVNVRMVYEPEGAMEKAGEAMALDSARIKGDLKRFKKFIEERGQETGGWRGEVRGQQVSRDAGVPRSQRIRGDKGSGTT